MAGSNGLGKKKKNPRQRQSRITGSALASNLELKKKVFPRKKFANA